jgi:hypothetical protein
MMMAGRTKHQYGRLADMMGTALGVFHKDKSAAQRKVDSFMIAVQDKGLPVGRLVDTIQKIDPRRITKDTDAAMYYESLTGRIGEHYRQNSIKHYIPFAEEIGRISLSDADVNELKRLSNAASHLDEGYVSFAIKERNSDDRSVLEKVKEIYGIAGVEKLSVADAYLYALHAKSRNTFIRDNVDDKMTMGSGMTDREANAIIGFIEKLPGTKRASFERIAQRRKAIVDDTNRRARENGLISSDVDSGMLNYVPLKGKHDPDEWTLPDDGTVSRSGPGGVIGPENRRMRGRVDFGENGLEVGIYPTSSISLEVMAQNQRTIQRSEKNVTANVLYDMIAANSDLDVVTGVASIVPEQQARELRKPMGRRANDRIMEVKRNGKTHFIELKDHHLLRAMSDWTGYNVTNTAITSINHLVKNAGIPGGPTLSGFTRWQADINTSWSPEFLISNPFRDAITALFVASQYEIDGLTGELARGIPAAAKAVYAVLRNEAVDAGYKSKRIEITPEMQEWVDAFLEYRDVGGVNATNMMDTPEDMLRNINTALRRIEEGSKKGNTQQVLKGFVGAKNSIKSAMEDYNSTAENMTRLAFYKALKKRGASPERAAQAARNLTTNFSRGGEMKTALNGAYLFFNASLQGTANLMTAVGRSKRVMRYAGAATAVSFMLDWLNAAMSDEDEDGKLLYDKIPDYDLQHNIIFMDPFGLTDRGYIKIPLAYGINLPWDVGRSTARALRGGWGADDAVFSVWETTIETFWPFGGQESIWNAFFPTVLDPVVDLMENEDFDNKPIYKEAGQFGVSDPPAYRHWTTTGPTWQFVAQAMNDLSFGNEVRPGMVSVSPDVLEYLNRYFLGAMGAFADRAINFGFSDVPDMVRGAYDEERIRQAPFVRKLYGTLNDRIDTSDFFDAERVSLLAEKELKRAVETRDFEWAREVREGNRIDLAVLPIFKGYRSNERKIRSVMRSIERNPSIPDDIKEARLDELRDRISSLRARALRAVRDRRAKMVEAMI